MADAVELPKLQRAAEQQQEDDPRAAGMTAWAKASGCMGFHQLRFGTSSLCQGLGAFATTTLLPGTVALTLPRKMAITIQTCHDAFPALERHRVPEFSSFVLYLVQQLYAAGTSKYRCYIESLPKASDMTSALYMTEREVAALPEAYAAACHQARARAAACWSCIDDLCRLHLSPEEAIMCSDDTARRWATAIVMSRAFRVCGRLMLLPAIDICNNAADGCVLEYNDAADLLLRVRRAYSAGEELFLCYGGTEGKPDEELLANYGYSSVLGSSGL